MTPVTVVKTNKEEKMGKIPAENTFVWLVRRPGPLSDWLLRVAAKSGMEKLTRDIPDPTRQ